MQNIKKYDISLVCNFKRRYTETIVNSNLYTKILGKSDSVNKYPHVGFKLDITCHIDHRTSANGSSHFSVRIACPSPAYVYLIVVLSFSVTNLN